MNTNNNIIDRSYVGYVLCTMLIGLFVYRVVQCYFGEGRSRAKLDASSGQPNPNDDTSSTPRSVEVVSTSIVPEQSEFSVFALPTNTYQPVIVAPASFKQIVDSLNVILDNEGSNPRDYDLRKVQSDYLADCIKFYGNQAEYDHIGLKISLGRIYLATQNTTSSNYLLGASSIRNNETLMNFINMHKIDVLQFRI